MISAKRMMSRSFSIRFHQHAALNEHISALRVYCYPTSHTRMSWSFCNGQNDICAGGQTTNDHILGLFAHRSFRTIIDERHLRCVISGECWYPFFYLEFSQRSYGNIVGAFNGQLGVSHTTPYRSCVSGNLCKTKTADGYRESTTQESSLQKAHIPAQ